MSNWGDRLEKERYLHQERHIRVFNSVKREDFVDRKYKAFTLSDEPLPLEHGQTQSAPHMNAIFVDLVNPTQDDSVMEIGTGSGYLTTILSFLSGKVISIEYYCDLARSAAKNIARYERRNVQIICGNVNSICLKAKFDAIISTSSFRKEPAFLFPLVKENGIFVFPLGSYPPQKLIMFKEGKKTEIGMVSFVTIVD
ncbi:MAG: protein-L-isoaspartate O-methyltransferase [Thermoplasmatales archaeon]